MWDSLKRQGGAFTSAVLNGRDADGYPASVRTAFTFDDAQQAVRVTVPAEAALQAGVASLLFHSHDEQLWDQQIVLVRGELVRAADGWLFRPLTFSLDNAAGGLAMLRLMLKLRKTAGAYLKKRGVARPAVPWARLNALKGKA